MCNLFDEMPEKKLISKKTFIVRLVYKGRAQIVALLIVSDVELYEGVSPIEFGDLPALQNVVTIVGYPIGGITISVISGLISCIKIPSYVHGSTELLRLQIDAVLKFYKKGRVYRLPNSWRRGANNGEF